MAGRPTPWAQGLGSVLAEALVCSRAQHCGRWGGAVLREAVGFGETAFARPAFVVMGPFRSAWNLQSLCSQSIESQSSAAEREQDYREMWA